MVTVVEIEIASYHKCAADERLDLVSRDHGALQGGGENSKNKIETWAITIIIFPHD